MIFESMQKEDQTQKGESAPVIDKEALEKAQKEFNEAYQAWLHAPQGEKSAIPPKLKEFIAGSKKEQTFEREGEEEKEQKGKTSEAVELDIDAFREAFRKYNLNPVGRKPEPGDFPLGK